MNRKKLSIAIAALGFMVLVVLSWVVWNSQPVDVDAETTLKDLGDTVRIEGQVTRVSPNCGIATVLEDGKVVELDDGQPVLCDGGGVVFVGEHRLQISTGLVLDGYSYEELDIKPGDRVRAIYVDDDSDVKSLGCESCYIEKL